MASVSQHRNRWRVRWRDEYGRQIVESFATKAEAEKAAKVIEARAVVDGRPPTVFDENALTLAKWWARWEPGQQWRATTRKTHASHWARWVRPVFGSVPVDQITAADIRRWRTKLESRGLSPRYIAACHRTLAQVLQGAVADALIVRNPASNARVRQAALTAPVALDRDQLAAMLDAVARTTPRLEVYGRLIAATGLRRAEAAGLTWDRVDLDGGMLTVDRQIDYGTSTQPTFIATKTGRTRHVPLTAATVELLRAHRAAQDVVSLAGLVFTTRTGKVWPRTTLSGAWRLAADDLAERGTPVPAGARGWHTLRHTTASRLLEAGVPPAEAAAMLGHSPEMLLRIYAHVVDRSAADARLRAALD
jgi:integrase